MMPCPMGKALQKGPVRQLINPKLKKVRDLDESESRTRLGITSSAAMASACFTPDDVYTACCMAPDGSYLLHGKVGPCEIA